MSNLDIISKETPGLTPMMVKYLETKEQYKDCILFYRLGDFYEMFFDDATVVSRELELVLTGKSCGLDERAPMCGIPFHAADTYLNRLIKKGYKVAICEQVEDPKLAKGLVKREVTRIVTPGTNTNLSTIDETKNNYILCICFMQNKTGVSICDITTGAFFLTECSSLIKLYDEISKYSPSEIVCNDAFLMSGMDIDNIRARFSCPISAISSHYFNDVTSRQTILDHFKVSSTIGMGIDDYPLGIIAAGALLGYLLYTQKNSLTNITNLQPISDGSYMILDSSTRRNLELCETMREKLKRGSLLWVLDKTKTAMGGRMLRSYIEQPLLRKDMIIYRQNAVKALYNDSITRDELREYMNTIYDLERLLCKVTYNSVNPRDMIALKQSLSILPHIKTILKEFNEELLKDTYEKLDVLEDVYSIIDNSIDEDPPLSAKEGGFIKKGYSDDIDVLRSAKTDGKTWLAELEATEKERTGIKNLRIKYNKVFGYYFEVTNSFLNNVPEDYIRKQTLTNCERFTTQRLKELEDSILNAEDKLYTLEYDVFCEIRNYIEQQIQRIQKSSEAIATLDAICSLSYVAESNNYICPDINEKGTISIKDGRHPVVEKVINNDAFIANDTFLDNKNNLINVITGPNMAGKSTYMRQVALIVLMAQIGSFVPAREANIGLVDRIFTRVGASDDLSTGQSTFMIEMNEVSNILRNATSDSLLILDEIGRGTSTFDGLSIAWSVIEYIANKKIIGAKTLFATHYHELTELEGRMSNVNNYCIAVKENGDDIVFLRKIVKGGADKSYGIQVARLAGVPEMVIERAKEIVESLIDNDITEKIQNITIPGDGRSINKKPIKYDDVDLNQMYLFDTTTDKDIIDELKNIDISQMTPLDGLNTLYKLQSKLKNRC